MLFFDDVMFVHARDPGLGTEAPINPRGQCSNRSFASPRSNDPEPAVQMPWWSGSVRTADYHPCPNLPGPQKACGFRCAGCIRGFFFMPAVRLPRKLMGARHEKGPSVGAGFRPIVRATSVAITNAVPLVLAGGADNTYLLPYRVRATAR